MSERTDRLLEEMREIAAEVPATVRGLTPASLEAGRYEGGWDGREIVAHLAAMEWTYPRLIAIARGELPAVDPPPPAAPGGAPIDAYNARQVERRGGVPVAELLDEFARNRERLLAVVAGIDDALLDTPARSANGREGTLEALLRFAAVEHVRAHLADLKGHAGR